MKMIKAIPILILSLIYFTSYSQKLQRSTVSMAGSSQTVRSGDRVYYVSQSIGQASTTGTFTNKGKTIRQGFQQPPGELRLSKPIIERLDAIVYPNPTGGILNIGFKDQSLKLIDVQLLDHSGKLLFKSNLEGTEHISIDMEPFSSGVFFLKIISEDKYLYTSVIKL